jgi:hypothetical protein
VSTTRATEAAWRACEGRAYRGAWHSHCAHRLPADCENAQTPGNAPSAQPTSAWRIHDNARCRGFAHTQYIAPFGRTTNRWTPAELGATSLRENGASGTDGATAGTEGRLPLLSRFRSSFTWALRLHAKPAPDRVANLAALLEGVRPSGRAWVPIGSEKTREGSDARSLRPTPSSSAQCSRTPSTTAKRGCPVVVGRTSRAARAAWRRKGADSQSCVGATTVSVDTPRHGDRCCGARDRRGG